MGLIKLIDSQFMANDILVDFWNVIEIPSEQLFECLQEFGECSGLFLGKRISYSDCFPFVH